LAQSFGRLVDQSDLENRVANGAELADFRAVDPDELRPLGDQSDEKVLAGFSLAEGFGRQGVEMLAIQRGCDLAHDAPPKTSTLSKRQTGDACPTRMSWLGSPLPQVRRPKTSRVAAFPTLLRLRQKGLVMAR